MTTSTSPQRLPLDDPRRLNGKAAAPPAAVEPARSVAELPDADEDFFPDADATKRLEGEEWGLPAGHWIAVRRMLTFGQQLHLQSQATGRVKTSQQEIEVDIEEVTVRKLLAWVTAWSFRYKGAPAPLDESHLRGMHPGLAAAVNAAVDRHIQAVQQGNPYATSGTTRP